MEKLLNQISKQIVDLKARYETRWDQHDIRAKELYNKVVSLETKIYSLNCKAHKEKINSLSNSVKILWGAFFAIIIGMISLRFF